MIDPEQKSITNPQDDQLTRIASCSSSFDRSTSAVRPMLPTSMDVSSAVGTAKCRCRQAELSGGTQPKCGPHLFALSSTAALVAMPGHMANAFDSYVVCSSVTLCCVVCILALDKFVRILSSSL